MLTIITNVRRIIKILTNHSAHLSRAKPFNVHKQSWLGMYDTLAMPSMQHGRESCTLKERDKSGITATDTKFLRKTAYTHS